MVNHLDHIGRWPVSGPEARKEKRMILIRPEDSLKLIHGRDNHVLVSMFVSNDFIHFATMTIPIGKHSDAEVHQGDEVIFVLEGTLLIQVYDEGTSDSDSVLQNVFKVQKHEKFLLPENRRHRYLNLGGEVTRFIFSVAPGI